MQAVILGQFGEPKEVLTVQDVPDPEPGPGQVRLRMLASPINPSDLMTVRGKYTRLPQLPATPGFEGSGVVESAGPGLLGKLLVGRRVAVLGAKTGCWAESAIAAARQVVPVPKSLSAEQAAMFFVNPMTAYVMVRRVLNVPPGEWLLQTAASSALAAMVVRLGRRFGFKTINVVRRTEQAERIRQIGGDEVVCCEPAELPQHVSRLTAGERVRYAIDPVGGAMASAVVKCLGSGGRLLLYGTLTPDPISFSPRDLMTPAASVEGFWLARWMERLSLFGKLAQVRAVSRLIQEGVLVSDVEHTFPLGEIAAAVTAAESTGRTGKTLLKIADD
jgi:NADPH:quinone reductase-like Zn-dependent oxidoreductase